MLVGGSVSGSLDPFKPFHRRFTRLHNAATLIKINYTLARQFALLSLSLLLSPGPALAVLAHPLVFSLPLFSAPTFFSLSPCRFFVPHFRPPPGQRPLSRPLALSLSLLSLSPLLVYLHFIRDLIYRPPATASLVRARLCDGIKKAGRG